MRRAAAFAAVELLKIIPWGESSGISCRYFKLSDRIGLKTYKYTGEGFNTYTHQLQMSRHDLAPKCWGFSEYNGIEAYFTEHCESALDRYNKLIDSENCKQACDEYSSKFEIALREYDAKCDSLNIYTSDTKMANMGWKGKRLVAVDIGHFSIGYGVMFAYLRKFQTA